MATAQQLKALIESYTERNADRFLSVASQIAAHAARAGKTKLAEELRKLVEEARRKQGTQPTLSKSIPIAQPTGDLSGLFSASFPKTQLSDMVLDKELEQRLKRVILEYRQADRLHSHGLAPRRKLLLVGPSGCGKSMTAATLASELHLPLLTVQFHILITKFMGETAAKLRLIFESMKESRGVYLFDEFDAIGAHRHTGQDVGEIRRVLNSFLVFLEQDESMSIIIAASNLEDVLVVCQHCICG
jgi:SpoVK/Ycf46/Vps4 family AAA+-type ATPase